MQGPSALSPSEPWRHALQQAQRGGIMVHPLAKAPPWPPMPDAVRGPQARMAWYAAVARWAPSKHNTQPWQFVVRDDALELYLDPDRALPATDPQRREMVISCGAAAQHA